MAPCGLAGRRHCTVSVSSHTLHLRVVIFFIIESFYRMFLDYFCFNLFIFIIMPNSPDVWAAVFTFNPYLLISINELLISIIHLLISIINLLISIIHLLISIIHLLISINMATSALFLDINK